MTQPTVFGAAHAMRRVIARMHEESATLTIKGGAFYLGGDQINPRTFRALDRKGLIVPIKNGVTPSYALSEAGRTYAARSAKIAEGKAARAAEDGAQGEAPAEGLTEAARLQHTALSRAIADLAAAVQTMREAQAEDRKDRAALAEALQDLTAAMNDVTEAQAEDRAALTEAIKDLRAVWE